MNFSGEWCRLLLAEGLNCLAHVALDNHSRGCKYKLLRAALWKRLLKHGTKALLINCSQQQALFIILLLNYWQIDFRYATRTYNKCNICDVIHYNFSLMCRLLEFFNTNLGNYVITELTLCIVMHCHWTWFGPFSSREGKLLQHIKIQLRTTSVGTEEQSHIGVGVRFPQTFQIN